MSELPDIRPDRALADALADPDVHPAMLTKRLAALTASVNFDDGERWRRLVTSEALSDWRRLAAYHVLIRHVLGYPLPAADFEAAALTPLGLSLEAATSQPLIQAAPLQRRPRHPVRRVMLPFQTSVGKAALYISHDLDSDLVDEAGVSPSPFDPSLEKVEEIHP